MKIMREEAACLHALKPLVMTIGNFDGVHLGHVALLERVKNVALQQGTDALVVTFSTHPAELLRPEIPLNKLTSEPQKYALIGERGIDYLLILDFSPAFAAQTVEQFFTSLLKKIPISHCILGYDAVLGRGREGHKEEVQRVAKQLGFTVEYLSPVLIEGVPVSSSLIRQLLESGHIAEAEKLLGRKKLYRGKQQKKLI